MAMTQDKFNSTVGKRIAAAQKVLGEDDLLLAAKAGFTERELKAYKAGERTPNGYRLMRIADALGVSLDYLIGRTKSSLPVA